MLGGRSSIPTVLLVVQIFDRVVVAVMHRVRIDNGLDPLMFRVHLNVMPLVVQSQLGVHRRDLLSTHLATERSA